MEEFVNQESKNLCTALTRGTEFTWPVTCRNCDFEFPSNLKSVVCKTLMKDPQTDVLKAVSDAVKSSCRGYNYCCINNFKPSYKQPFDPPVSDSIRYYVYTETLMIEEGLDEWYEVSWDDEETPISAPAKSPEEFSLFDMVVPS